MDPRTPLNNFLIADTGDTFAFYHLFKKMARAGKYPDRGYLSGRSPEGSITAVIAFWERVYADECGVGPDIEKEGDEL